MSERRRLEFDVGHDRCVAYFYCGMNHQERLPTIVMAHGFSGTQEGSLARTASDFADAGFSVLTFDYRGFGESAGSPRQVIDIDRQRVDWRTAIAFARTIEGVDPDRIALWGSSLSGAHVVHLAADDPRIIAVVAQVPFNGFPKRVEGRAPKETLALFWLALKDWFRAKLGRSPLYVPVIAPTGERAVISTDRADAIIAGLRSSHWENRVAARVILQMITCQRPARVVHNVRSPLLVCIAERDAQTPPELARQLVDRAPNGTAKVYPSTHFELYDDPLRSAVVADQIDFLRGTA